MIKNLFIATCIFSIPAFNGNAQTITGVTVRVDSLNKSVNCPVAVTFIATIYYKGTGTIVYKWERSDGASSSNNRFALSGSGKEVVTTTWTLHESSKGSETLKIISPVQLSSDKAGFAFECLTAPIGKNVNDSNFSSATKPPKEALIKNSIKQAPPNIPNPLDAISGNSNKESPAPEGLVALLDTANFDKNDNKNSDVPGGILSLFDSLGLPAGNVKEEKKGNEKIATATGLQPTGIKPTVQKLSGVTTPANFRNGNIAIAEFDRDSTAIRDFTSALKDELGFPEKEASSRPKINDTKKEGSTYESGNVLRTDFEGQHRIVDHKVNPPSAYQTGSSLRVDFQGLHKIIDHTKTTSPPYQPGSPLRIDFEGKHRLRTYIKKG